MKISRLLFKPKWQDKEAAVRLAAVAADTDAELQTALPELTRSDPDARVRLAALKRLNDYERWRERSTGDADAEVRRAARTAYIALLCSDAAGNPPLRRRISELETLSPAEIETVATSARDRELRAAALAMATRPALLAERATADPDPALRVAALQRITDAATLERIAERARKTDKAVNRIARERLDSLRIGAGDADAIATKARLLCEKIEAMLRNPRAETTRIGIEQEWATLGTRVPGELQTRFAGAVALLAQLMSKEVTSPRSGPVREAAAPLGTQEQPGEDSGGPATAAPVQDPIPPSVSDAIASRARFDAALVAAAEESRREREQRQALLHRVESLIPRYAEKLDAGDTAAAHAVRDELAELCGRLDTTPPAVERSLTPLHARYAELRRWQHWSNQRRRRSLCDEIEALAETGAHPDAIATRVREAREEWLRLDAAESGDGAPETSGLARRFHGACQRALKPAQKYFERRDAVRDAHRMQLDALLGRVDALPADTSDWKAMTALRRELADSLRSLDRFSPRDRTTLAKRIKRAIAVVAPRIDAHAEAIKTAKARLIEQAAGLAEKADRNAVRAVRELQQQWTALGEGLRGVDQKQWREFRAACDRVFAGLDAERREREDQAAALAGQAQALVGELEALARDTTVDAEALSAGRRDLEARWRATGTIDRGLEARWRRALDALSARNAERERDKRVARYSLALRKYALLRDLERGASAAEPLDAEWESQAPLIAAFAQPLDLRWKRARNGETSAPDTGTIEAARDILVRLEFAAGIASPEDDRQRRMDFQVARLSARMRGTAQSGDPDSQLVDVLSGWFALPGPLPEDLELRFAGAARAALAALP